MSLNSIILLLISILLTATSLLQISVQYLVPLHIICIAIIIIMFIYQYKDELTFSRIFLLLLACLGFSIYAYFRCHFAILDKIAIAKFGNGMSGNALTTFATTLKNNSALYFSFGYGILQIISGAVFSLSPLMASLVSYIGCGVVLLAIAFSCGTYTPILFGILGVLSIGLNLNTMTVPGDNFSSKWYASLSIYPVAFAFYITSGILIPLTTSWSWSTIYISLAMVLIAIGVLYLLCSKWIDAHPIKLEKEVTEIVEQKVTTSQIISLFVYCILVVIPFYAIQGKMLSVVAGDALITGELSGLLCLLIPTIEHLGEANLMYGSVILGIVGLIIISMTSNTIMLKFAVACLTAIAMSHNMPFVIIGKRMKNAGLIFGTLNFGAMFLGCFGGQFLISKVLVGYSTPTIAMIFIPVFALGLLCTYLSNR